ncbi:hypothetical protein F7P73_05180 [Acinetobacter bohemicus]|uniref:Uncharacterized protein n=1 Tax=Acinetobacter bohemicus TaxID=1435036 RepID=A0A1I6QIF8_9GAMM|nr:hypothetical protein F7P73_05180 [Acinetobacter bohemicus]SFS52259.1 hypothetical protein SAMN05444586_100472 [Acinetobacter bohemicus]
MIRNAHLFKTVNYDRKIGVLTREDYSYMRDLLETALEQLQNSELDKDSEIDRLKQFFIKFDHHVERLR